MPHGFPDQDWDAAKEEAREVLIDRARKRGMISYSELVREIRSIRIAPEDPRLAHFLDEISRAEDAAGRGMLTVLVVHKTGDREPGPGFFELARSLGRDTSDRTQFWVDEFKRVHAAWE